MEVKLKVLSAGCGDLEGRSPEEIIVYAARVSSSRSDKFENPEGLLAYCIKNKHWSIFETASMTVEITTSRSIGTQLLRHRSFTFQQFSTRYNSDVKFENVELRAKANKNRQSSTEVIGHLKMTNGEEVSAMSMDDMVTAHMKQTELLYSMLLKNNVASECAREILPLCTSTTLYMTGNVRSWIHFLEVRDDGHAQKEIQLIAKEVKKIFINQFPIISKSLNYVRD